MALKGKGMVVNVSTDDTVYNVVDDLNDASMSLSGENLDITKFNDAFIRRMQGLKDASYSLSGFYNPTDTNGQAAIRGAWLNDTLLYVKFLPDGTTGFKQAVKVSSFEVSAGVDGNVEVSIELEGDGVITAV